MFREHDRKLFDKLRPAYGEDERYVNATRASRETFERLIRVEMDRLAAEDEAGDEAGEVETPRRLEARGQ